ncbi:hypothetical protein CROQUDRAFT_27716, partial [Cronartium quercuum f. sp. fusiforme G11]
FENLMRAFYYCRGEISYAESARTLILAIPTLSKHTVEVIYTSVVPLTCYRVLEYLKSYKDRHGLSSEAIREANGVTLQEAVRKDQQWITPTHCVGPPLEKNCWSKPGNNGKRRAFLCRMCGRSSTPLTSASNHS